MSDTKMVQVETTTRLRESGYNLEAGDRITVPEALAKYWAGLGWAKPVRADTGIEPAAKKPGAQRVNVENLKHIIRTPEV